MASKCLHIFAGQLKRVLGFCILLAISYAGRAAD
jgi:hypothetical protein